jgi:pimeloyl-ACP methyl ester carboxylesterase/DNA-binding CsgD family transcriptional regulator
MGERLEADTIAAPVGHDLVSAVYAATLSPENFNATFDTLDELLFNDVLQDAEEIGARAARVSAHVAIVRSIQERIGLARTHEQKLHAILESVPNPSYLITRSESVLAANALALAKHRIAPRTLRECLADDHVLQQVHAFIARNSAEKLLAVAGPDGSARKTQISVLVKRVDADLLSRRADPIFLLSIVDFGFDDDTIDLFRRTYGLTQAESRVAVLLASGWRVPDIAAERGASVETVRTQIKLVKSKTAARDIPDLVRLLCGLSAGVLAPTLDRTRDSSPFKSRRQFVLRDGRRMDYLDQGAANGRPVLLFHNLPYGVELPAAAIRQAHADNLRFIAPFRPGYGRSDPVANLGTEALLSQVARDSHDLLVHLGISRATVLSHSVGASFALRFAAQFPDRVTRLVAVSRAPAWRDEWLAQAPQRQRFMLRLIRYTPKLLPVVAWAMVSAMDSRYANEFVVYNCKDGPADAKAVQDQEIVDLIAKGSVEALRHGTDAFCRESQLALLDLTAEARAAPHKFHILHGDDDRIVQLAQSQAFANAVPGTTLQVVPGAGQLLFFSHWRSVLAAV